MCRKGSNDATPVATKPAEGPPSPWTSRETRPRILMCSENVPPQVNGIARRIGHYCHGLEKLGCDVELLCPDSKGQVWAHANPWNFTAAMMILFPGQFFSYLMQEQLYDVVHVVMPLNLSGMWLLAGYKMLRTYYGTSKPALVISWHCNLFDYADHHFPKFLCDFLRWVIFDVLLYALPEISDRILTPTRATEKNLTSKWEDEIEVEDIPELARTGVCYTGLDKTSFHPGNKLSEMGQHWKERKAMFLKEKNCRYLLVCVGRLSPEKGIDELLSAMPLLNGCGLWLVGDGPDRKKYEAMVEELKLPVKFWGYQRGQALHSVYTMADCFVCPSLTETFGQTVNEALASEVRVALPKVKVFSEAFSEYLPPDAFWEPHNDASMAAAIQKQLERHATNDPVGKPDADLLKSWDDACRALLQAYENAEAVAKAQTSSRLRKRSMFWLPAWFFLTVILANYLYLLALIRSSLGGLSLRYYLKTMFKKLLDSASRKDKIS